MSDLKNKTFAELCGMIEELQYENAMLQHHIPKKNDEGANPRGLLRVFVRDLRLASQCLAKEDDSPDVTNDEIRDELYLWAQRVERHAHNVCARLEREECDETAEEES